MDATNTTTRTLEEALAHLKHMFGEASDDLASVDHEEELKQGQADLRLIDEALNG